MRWVGREAGELLDGGLPISRLQPLTHVSDRPPKAPVIRGQLIERERGREGGGEERRGGETGRQRGKEGGSQKRGRIKGNISEHVICSSGDGAADLSILKVALVFSPLDPPLPDSLVCNHTHVRPGCSLHSLPFAANLLFASEQQDREKKERERALKDCKASVGARKQVLEYLLIS